MKLDRKYHVFVCSFALYNSRYNYIEIAWANMSKALAQTTLMPNYKDFD